jgi:cysteine desulfurase
MASAGEFTVRRIYLDANATTPLLPEVLEAMRPYLIESFGNASSIHQRGQQVRAAIERAREAVAAMFGCRPAEVVFNSGGTEGDNTALFGVVRPGDHMITTAVEHHAVLQAAEKLAARGAEVTVLGVDGNGLIDAEDVRRALRPNTRLISVMMANNETGAILPAAEIGRVAREAGVLFHTDAVQAAGKMPIDVRAIGCDLLTISGHKMHAPQGIGAMYVRRGVQIEPLLYGGLQERTRRAGTENVAAIVALGCAAGLAMQSLAGGAMERVAALRDRLESGVLARLEGTGAHAAGVARVANTTNLWFEGLEGEALVIALDLKGVAASGGSACQSGAVDPSHVLAAMGPLAGARARSSLRFSLMKQTTEEEIDAVLGLLPEAVARLRELSPQWVARGAAMA